MLFRSQPRTNWQAIAGKKNFVGGQRIYTWRQLEPELGRYDFSAIEADIAMLRGQKQRLFLEIWDNHFLGESTPPVPDYLLAPAYQGGISHPAHHQKVTRTKRWIPAVMDRYLALVAALGQRFDNDPDFAWLIHTETAMEWEGPGFEDMTFAAYHQQMLRLVEASRKAFPHTPIVLNHTGFPWDRSEDGLRAWRAAMEAIAACPNVRLKVSELGVKGMAWTVEGNRQVVRDAIAIFGLERCMFATNWPVCTLTVPYADLVDGICDILADLDEAAWDAFFCGNAAKFYRVDLPAV